MAKSWAGYGTYVLPARKVEPYRLWFEFLKLAYQTQTSKSTNGSISRGEMLKISPSTNGGAIIGETCLLSRQASE